MGGFYTPGPALGPVRVVAFSGRESDAPLGVWGAIAEQLGRKERFNDYYAPLAAPGQTAWVNLLRGEPLVVMLDELPPYFVNAAAKSIGSSDLAAVTTTALSNLLVAIGRDELRNVCLVISDLKASYGAGAARIGAALDDLEAETGHAAMNLEPVRMNTDEFYRILRKRIFAALPSEAEIEEVAGAYAKAVREARQMDVTNASPERSAGLVGVQSDVVVLGDAAAALLEPADALPDLVDASLGAGFGYRLPRRYINRLHPKIGEIGAHPPRPRSAVVKMG